MHVNLELLEDAFGYKKGEILPALKDHIGYIMFEKNHTRIFIENDNNCVKEVDYIKKMRHREHAYILYVTHQDEHSVFGYADGESAVNFDVYDRIDFEEIKEEEKKTIEKIDILDYDSSHFEAINKINELICFSNK